MILAVIFIVATLLPVLLLALYCLYPGKRRDIRPFTAIKYAHRGLYSDTVPENSLAAFAAAKEAGFGVELDIQFTADKQIVVFHDADLKRMCNVDKRINELTYEELRQYTLLNSNEHIPQLQDVLTLLDDTPVLCELKSYAPVTDCSLCEAAYPLLRAYSGPLCIESFNPFMVRWFRQQYPEIVRGILSMRYDDSSGVTRAQQFLLSALLTNFLTRPDFIAFRYEDRHLLSFRICRQLYRSAAFAWTIQSQATQNNALGTFDTVIFEKYIPTKS